MHRATRGKWGTGHFLSRQVFLLLIKGLAKASWTVSETGRQVREYRLTRPVRKQLDAELIGYKRNNRRRKSDLSPSGCVAVLGLIDIVVGWRELKLVEPVFRCVVKFDAILVQMG